MQYEKAYAHSQRQQVRATLLSLVRQGLSENEACTGLMVESVNLMSQRHGPEFAAAWLRGIAAKLETEASQLVDNHNTLM